MVEALLLELVSKFPNLMGLFVGIGVFRLLFKPVMTLLHAVVDATPGVGDNAFLARVENSSVYKAVAFVVDYLLSIKLPGQK